MKQMWKEKKGKKGKRRKEEPFHNAVQIVLREQYNFSSFHFFFFSRFLTTFH